MTTLLKLTMMAALLTVLPLHLEAMPTRGITSQEVGQAAEQLKQLLAEMMQEEAKANYRGYYDQAKANQYPLQAKANQYPLQAEANQYPLQAEANQYPLQAEANQYPLQAKANQYPLQAKANQYPLQAKANQYPLQAKANQLIQGVNIVNCGPAGEIVKSSLSVLNIFFTAGQFGVLVDCKIAPDCVQVKVDVGGKTISDIDVCSKPKPCVKVFAESPGQCSWGIPLHVPIPLPNGQKVSVTILSSIFPTPCASVKVDAPRC